jgi:DNA-binding NarL/FixJ family response regulator
MQVIKVLLVDDNELLRRGLHAAIEAYDDIHVIGQGGTGKEAVQLCRELVPDVVLMDIKMPVMNGVDATRLIHQEFPSIGIVILTNDTHDGIEEAAREAGAKAFLTKDVTLEAIANAIRAAVS